MTNPEILSSSQPPKLTEIISNQYIDPDAKTTLISNQYDGIQVPNRRPYLDRWATILSPETKIPFNPQQINTIIEKYRALDNIDNGDPGQKASHKLFVNFQFPNELLPCLTTIYQYGIESNDRSAIQSSVLSLIILNDALDVLAPTNPQLLKETDTQNLSTINQLHDTKSILSPFDYPPENSQLAIKLPILETSSMRGRSTTLQEFYTLMALATQSATETILTNVNKPIEFSNNFPFSSKIHFKNYNSVSAIAVEIVKELNQGIDFPKKMENLMIYKILFKNQKLYVYLLITIQS